MDPSPIPPQPVQPPKKRNYSLVIILALLAIMLFAPIPYYQTARIMCNPSQECPKPGWYTQPSLFEGVLPVFTDHISPTGFPSPTPTPDPTANWKTYTNQQLGFSVQYPPTWKVIIEEDRKVGWSTMITDNEEIKTATQSIQVNLEYSNVFEIPWSGGKKIVITKDNLGYYAYAGDGPATTVFLGRPAIKSVDASPLTGRQTSLRILNGKRLITVIVSTKDEKLISLHDQILSTFKFIDSTIGQNETLSIEGQSCGGPVGIAGGARCAPGLMCLHKNLKDPSDIGTCVK